MGSGAFEILSGRLVRFGEILVLCCNLVKKNIELLWQKPRVATVREEEIFVPFRFRGSDAYFYAVFSVNLTRL